MRVCLQTRFCVKYRHCDGALVLKITDDKTVSLVLTRHAACVHNNCQVSLHTVVFYELFPYIQCVNDQFCSDSVAILQCVKYQTDQLQDVKKLEKLNNVLMRHMVSRS